MTDAFRQLPPFQWRGQKYPIVARSVSFTHENVQHKVQYRSNEFIEQTGPRSPTFSYTIPMRQDIAKGPYRNLFSEGLPVLFRDTRNREAGPLIDPVYGQFTVVPTSFSDEADPNKRDGVDVKVEFLLQSDLNEDEQLQSPSLQDIATEAGALDGALLTGNWQQEPPPESMIDILSAINGLAFVGQRALDKTSAALNDLAFKLEKIENTVDRTTDPKNWPIKRDARRLRELVLRASIFGETPLEPRKRSKTRARMTITAAAAKFGMTVEQFLSLNPQFARSPFVPAGATVRVPSRTPSVNEIIGRGISNVTG